MSNTIKHFGGSFALAFVLASWTDIFTASVNTLLIGMAWEAWQAMNVEKWNLKSTLWDLLTDIGGIAVGCFAWKVVLDYLIMGK